MPKAEKQEQNDIDFIESQNKLKEHINNRNHIKDSLYQMIKDSLLRYNPINFVIGSVDKMYYLFDSSKVVLQTYNDNGYDVLRFGKWQMDGDSIHFSYFKEVLSAEILTSTYETPQSDGVVSSDGWEKTINKISVVESFNWVQVYNKLKSGKSREWYDWSERKGNSKYDDFFDSDSIGNYRYVN